METTDWDSYGTGSYEKCANCMAHCGYEPTAAAAIFNNPLQALKVALARRAHRRPDGAGNLAREPAPGAIRVLRAGAEQAVRDPHCRGAARKRAKIAAKPEANAA